MSGSDCINGTRIFRNSMYLRASWVASVGNMRPRFLRSSKSLEQKKEAPSCPSANNLSAIVFAMALFPVPASPFSQYMGGLSGSLAQSSIASRTATRVPLRQPFRSPCRYSAPFARRKLLRTDFSAVRASCQIPIVQNGDHSDLYPVKQDYLICPEMKGEALTIRSYSRS